MAIHSADHGGISESGETNSGQFSLTGEQIFSTTGTSNDVALNADVSIFRCTGATAQTITGFTGGTTGRMLHVIGEGAGSVTFNHQTGSAAANQITSLGGNPTSLGLSGGALLRYDGSKWRVLGVASNTYSAFATTSTLTASSSVSFSSNNSPTSISGTNNDWAPTPAFRQRIAASAAATITGLSSGAGTAGRWNWLQNISAFNITITHEDSGSTAANRFANPNNASVVITPGGSAYSIYDSVLSRWVILPGAGCTATQTVFAGATQTDTSTGTVNDFALSASATILRCNPGSTLTVTGITGGVDGRLLIIENVSTTSAVAFTAEGAGSTAANRIYTPGSASVNLTATATGTASVLLIYDGTSSRWRVLLYMSANLSANITALANFTVNGNTRLGDANTDLVGFYTTAGSAQQALVALTDNTTGAANDTLEALTSGTVYSSDVAAIRNNFADLAAKVNAVRTILLNLGIVA